MLTPTEITQITEKAERLYPSIAWRETPYQRAAHISAVTSEREKTKEREKILVEGFYSLEKYTAGWKDGIGAVINRKIKSVLEVYNKSINNG